MNKKRFTLLIVGLAVVVIAGLTTLFITKKMNSETTYIGFYDIPEKYYNAYEEVITKDNNGKIKLVTLTDKDINSNNITKKIDLLITYNGYVTQSLIGKAKALPSDIISRFSRTINSSPLFTDDNIQKIFPITLDLFETLLLTTAVNHYDLPVPSIIEEINDFGLKAQEIYPIPIVVSGGDDFTLNCLFTQLVDAFGGIDGYYNVAEQMKEDPSLDDFYNYVVTTDSSTGENITVSTLLDYIKMWEDKSILSKTWRTTLPSSTAQLIEDNRTTMALMTLSEHRNVASNNLNYYEPLLFPSYEGNNSNRVSIQPCVVGMVFRDTPQTKIITSRLTTSDNQELLSLQTQMGPTTLQGTSFDRQADDCRFFAASFPGGPVPDLATLVFSDKEMMHQMAELIRNY